MSEAGNTLEWNNMPPRDPPQPHMDDQTSLYLRLASTEADASVREMLLDTIGMTKEVRAGCGNYSGTPSASYDL